MLVPFFGKQFHANFDSDVEQLGPPHPGRPQLEELAVLPPPQLHLRLCRALLRGLDQLTGSHFGQVHPVDFEGYCIKPSSFQFSHVL